MLRLQELLKAIRHAQLVGERPYGHFDHDAKAHSGPPSREHLQSFPAGVPGDDPYEPREDAATGELFYVKKQQTRPE